jgi:hypothetical protein
MRTAVFIFCVLLVAGCTTRPKPPPLPIIKAVPPVAHVDARPYVLRPNYPDALPIWFEPKPAPVPSVREDVVDRSTKQRVDTNWVQKPPRVFGVALAEPIGNPPFLIESSVNLTDWQEFAWRTNAEPFNVTATNVANFFRAFSSP